MDNSAKPDQMTALLQDPVVVLQQFLEQVPETRRLLIGYSGGMDSHVLLHAAMLCQATRPDLELLALHIDHGMQSSSSEWANHCRNVCRDLGVPLKILKTNVVVDPSQGPEASARIARYSLFSTEMRESDYLLLAQHADDQAETFLLQALRGSGPDGLASIPKKRQFGPGWLCRPLLSMSHSDLNSWARMLSLKWIEDPSNQDTRLDRNFLRHEVIPLLQSRWPALNQTLSRSASRSGAASQLLLALAREDLELVRYQGAEYATTLHQGEQLEIPTLRSLGQERLFNVLRLWVRDAGYSMPRLQDLRQVDSDLLRANEESAGVVNVRNYEFRRYGELLFLMPPQTNAKAYSYEWSSPYVALSIPEAGLTLTAAECAAQGLQLPHDTPVSVRSRIGGELIRLGEPAFHKAVKKLLQESRVPPWRRDVIPLIYIGGKLAAVWQVVVSRDFQTETA